MDMVSGKQWQTRWGEKNGCSTKWVCKMHDRSITYIWPPCGQQSTLRIKLSGSSVDYFVSEQCAKLYYINAPSDLPLGTAILEFIGNVC